MVNGEDSMGFQMTGPTRNPQAEPLLLHEEAFALMAGHKFISKSLIIKSDQPRENLSFFSLFIGFIWQRESFSLPQNCPEISCVF